MKKSVFKIGDRVEATVNHPSGNSYIMSGDLGTVVKANPYDAGVEWDKSVGGHDCCCGCKQGHGWFVRIDEIVVVDDIINDDIEVDGSDLLVLFGGVCHV